MVFSSTAFLAFFAVVLMLYWLVRSQAARLLLLAVASATFYVMGEGADTIVLVMAIALGFLAGRAMEMFPRFSAAVLFVGVVGCLAMLGVYKYSNFILINIAPFTRIEPPESSFMAPPLGLSFFLFEVISYLVDIRRNVTQPQRSVLNFGLYVGFFPHLIAGPIVRTRQLVPQFLEKRTWTTQGFLFGLQTFTEGMAKKLLLADPCGAVADRVFASPIDWNAGAIALGVLAYTVQIWGDFSGYTDMGRGAARMLGYELPQNFMRPYLALSPRDFWRRWHITLSTWLRDYLYIPLGGNHGGTIFTYRNLLITMLLGGLWHGAAWTFVIWGAYHGLLLIIDHAMSKLLPNVRVPALAAWTVTLLAVMHGWILFRATSIWNYLDIMRGLGDWQTGAALPIWDMAIVGAAAAAMFLAMLMAEHARASVRAFRWLGPVQGLAYGLALGGLVYLGSVGSKPFIYFQF